MPIDHKIKRRGFMAAIAALPIVGPSLGAEPKDGDEYRTYVRYTIDGKRRQLPARVMYSEDGKDSDWLAIIDVHKGPGLLPWGCLGVGEMPWDSVRALSADIQKQIDSRTPSPKLFAQPRAMALLRSGKLVGTP